MRATSTIRAIAHALPATCLTYEELAKRFGEKQVASIFRMSGIRNRRVVASGQCASDLAAAAARRLFERAGVDPSGIDALIFVSQTPDHRTPATACKLQNDLGLPERCSTFDMTQACASFIFGLQVAHSMVVAETAHRVLLLNGDALSTLINPNDRGLATLHGDGAAATLVEPLDAGAGGIEFFEVGVQGKDFDRLLVPAGGARLPSGPETRVEETDEAGCVRSKEQLFMDGPAIFHFVLYKIKDFLKELLQRRKLSIDDYDLVLFHQANKTMVDLLYKNLDVPAEKRYYYLEDVGNSSGASLPSLLAQAWREGKVAPGSRTLLCSFGGGLSWGAVSLRWPADADAAVEGEVDVGCGE
ncbi:MAG: ketoacyl-ACP synthase III [Pirellulales bacterium]|nr:ketoacyl-ACP synthase III [Pirellulales bacterium]